MPMKRIKSGDMTERVNRYEVGQRVKYEKYGTLGEQYKGEGIITATPKLEAFKDPTWIAGRYYRVRHDGGTSTYYVEVGILEDEIVEVVG